MRPSDRRPSDSDFVSASEYEREAPATFNSPEVAVLYLSLDLRSVLVWIASDGFYIYSEGNGMIYDSDEVKVLPTELVSPNATLQITADEAQKLHKSSSRCVQVFGHCEKDDLESAEAVDYETGDADDLGDPTLIQNFGEGSTCAEGPITAVKRGRSD